MGFFSFLGRSLSVGPERGNEAARAATEDMVRRKAIPYELSMMRDQASNSRVAASEIVRMEEAGAKARSAVRGLDKSAPPMVAKPSYNATALYDLPVTESATGAVAPETPAVSQEEEFIDWWTKDGKAAKGKAAKKAAVSTGSKFMDSLWGAAEDAPNYDPAAAAATLEKRIADAKAALGETRTTKGWPRGEVKIPLVRNPIIRKRLEKEVADMEQQLKLIKSRGPRKTEAVTTSFPTGEPKDLRPAAQGGASFDNLVGKILRREGGYQNNPDDAGNWTGGKKGVGENKGTKFGISAASYPNLDIKNLTREQAVAIYKRDYWDAIGADQLPENLRDTAFDAAVNQGVGAAKKWLAQSNGNAETFNMFRGQRYDALAQRPGQAQFKPSWDARLSEVSMATTPGEAVMQGTGEPGMNTDMYIQDPQTLSFDQQNLSWMYQNTANRLQVLEGMADAMDPFEYMNAVQQLQSQIIQINTALTVNYAYQGLQMAQAGQTDLLQQAMRTITGVGYTIKPYQGGFYELFVDGNPTADGIMPYDAFVTEVRSLIDPAYAQSIAAAQAEASSKIAEIKAQTEGDLMVEGVKGRNAILTAVATQGAGMQRDIAVEQEKARIAKEAGLSDTKATTPDGNPIFKDPRTNKNYVLVLRTKKVRGKPVSTYEWEETLIP